MSELAAKTSTPRSREASPEPASGCSSDDGIATVWAAAGVAAIMATLLVGLHLGGAIAARHRAESAADLAALAAAMLAVQGQVAACHRAAEVAGAVGGEIGHCRLSGWEAVVEVRFTVPMALTGAATAVGRARAGPVAAETPTATSSQRVVPDRARSRRIEGGGG